MKLEYTHNNSGGSWWLTDDDWRNLEKAGWTVEWSRDGDPEWGVEDGRWLGALATRAWIETDDPDEAVRKWGQITGQNPHDEGCNCCGQPHWFSYTDDEGRWHSLETIVETRYGGWT